MVLFMEMIPSSHGMDLRGYSKGFFQSQENQAKSTDLRWLTWSNRLSLMPDVSDQVRLEISYQFIAERAEQNFPDRTEDDTSQHSYRFDDLSLAPFQVGDQERVRQNLDRLFLTWQSERRVVTFGRQTISLGVSPFISPFDVITPFAIGSLDQEERAGVDALRWRQGWGAGELDLMLIVGHDAKEETSAAIAKWLYNSAWFEWQLLAGRFRSRSLAGGALQGDWWGGGWNLEAVFIDGDSRNWQQASLSNLYRLPDDFVIQTEIHYSSLGVRGAMSRLQLYQDLDFVNARLRYTGRWYFSSAVSREMSPLWSFSLSQISNLEESSSLVQGILVHSLAEEVDTDLGIIAPLGKGEFEFFGRLYYLSLRYYF